MSNLTGITPYNVSTNYLFIPTQISGCALWLDGADPLNNRTTPTSGTVISTWSDKSGNGRNATVASGRIAGTFNTGFNCVYFQASNVGYVTSYAADPTVETMFIVANIDSPANINNNTIIGGQRGARAFGFGYAGSGGSGRSSYLNNQIAWQNNSIVGPATGTTALITGTVSGTTNVTVSLNGATATSGTIAAWTAGTTTYLGVDTTTTIYYFKGYVMEILFYNSVLITSQRQQIEGYLAWKWGTQRSLPTTHPYYNNAYLSNSYPISYFPPRLTPTSVVPTVPGFTIPTTITQYVFNPRSISGAALWLDAADPLNNGTQPTSGTVISTWSDKSGNGRNGTTTSNIIYTRDPQGRVAQLITSNQRYSIPTFVPSLTSQITVFCLINQLTTVGAGNVDMIAGTPYNNFTMNLAIATNRFGVFLNNGSVSLLTTYGTINTPAIYESTYSPNTGTAFVNGTSFGSFTTVPGTALTTSQVFNIGGNATTNYYYHELLFYNTALTTNQRQQVEGYLAWKWGLQSNLPANHPFKLFPP